MPSRLLCQSPRGVTAAPAPQHPPLPQVDPAATLAGYFAHFLLFVPTSYLARSLQNGAFGIERDQLEMGWGCQGTESTPAKLLLPFFSKWPGEAQKQPNPSECYSVLWIICAQ